MKALLVTLALLALAASAASTYTTGGCGACQPPHPPPPPMHPLPPPMHPLPPPPHPCPACPPMYPSPPTYPSPCPYPGHCGGVGIPPPPPMLGQCVEFLRQQCSPTATPTCSPQCNALRQQCCQQIRQVEPLHRYQAIYGVALQLLPPGHPLAAVYAAQIAQQLLGTCGLHQPSPCLSCNAANAPAGMVQQ